MRCWACGISRATVLAQQTPDLDGKVFSADRYSEKTTSVKGEPIDLWYSGKAHEHGGNIQALSVPDGFPLWVSDVEPGSVHDLTAAREPRSSSPPGP